MTERGPTYRIVDEPSPSGLARFATNPYFPLLAYMVDGAWLAFPWFALNAMALNGPERTREILLAVGALVGAFVIAVAAAAWVPSWGPERVDVLRLVLTVYKLAFAYWLYELQQPTANLFEHFGGELKSPVVVLVLGFMARVYVITSVPALALVFA
jgi:hypothetical protein